MPSALDLPPDLSSADDGFGFTTGADDVHRQLMALMAQGEQLATDVQAGSGLQAGGLELQLGGLQTRGSSPHAGSPEAGARHEPWWAAEQKGSARLATEPQHSPSSPHSPQSPHDGGVAKGGRGGRGRGRGRGTGTGMVVQPPSSSSVDATATLAPPPPPTNADADSSSCVVCYDHERTHALVPCGHLCLCSTCSEMLLSAAARAAGVADSLRCPVCRAPCESAMRVFT